MYHISDTKEVTSLNAHFFGIVYTAQKQISRHLNE